MNKSILSRSGISIERLVAFSAIYRGGSIVKAAHNDSNRQSLLSRQLGELEKALEVRLFRREKKKLIPTKAARELFLLLQEFGSALDQMVVRERKGKQLFQIAASRHVLDIFVVGGLGTLSSQLPQFRWTIRSGNTVDLCKWVKNGELDLVIVRQDSDLDGLAIQPFAKMEYALAVHRSLLPEKSAAGIDLLAQLPIVTLWSEGRYVQGLETMAHRLGFNLNIVAELASFELIFKTLEQNPFAAILPRVIAVRLPSETYALIEDDVISSLTRSLVVAYRRGTQNEHRIREIIKLLEIKEKNRH